MGSMTIEPLEPPTGPRSPRSTPKGSRPGWPRSRRTCRAGTTSRRRRSPGTRSSPRLDGEVAGWAILSRVSSRAVYSGVAEDSVYVAAASRGRGVGRALLDALVAGADAAGIWTIQTAIFPENEASLALHERCGFRVVGRRERIAQLDGVWRDTLFLERRGPDPTKKNGAA